METFGDSRSSTFKDQMPFVTHERQYQSIDGRLKLNWTACISVIFKRWQIGRMFQSRFCVKLSDISQRSRRFHHRPTSTFGFILFSYPREFAEIKRLLSPLFCQRIDFAVILGYIFFCASAELPEWLFIICSRTKLHRLWIQETQLSLTNRATRLEVS